MFKKWLNKKKNTFASPHQPKLFKNQAKTSWLKKKGEI